jgi:hypothetical protein
MGISDDRLRELEEQARALVERGDRARRRLQERPSGDWSFAMVGLPQDFGGCRIGEVAEIRLVEEPPTATGLASADCVDLTAHRSEHETSDRHLLPICCPKVTHEPSR